MHIKYLELGWANPQLPTRWVSYGFKEITKRACRYILVLNECFVQLYSLKIHNWYEISKFKKIIYHLSLFLRYVLVLRSNRFFKRLCFRSQTKLAKISFCNAYLNKTDFIKIFISCQNSENTLTHLDLRNCYYQYEQNVLSVQFVSIIGQLTNLLVLKTDYSTLCREIIGALLTSKNNKLEHLYVSIQDDEMSQSVKEEAWEALKGKCPKLKVTLYFSTFSQCTF